MERKIIDKAILTNVLSMRVIYTISDREMTTNQIVKKILRQKSTRTFNLSSIKEALKRIDVSPKPRHLDEFAFLAKHVAGGEYVLIKVVYYYRKKKESFIITEVVYGDSKWKKGVFVAHGYD